MGHHKKRTFSALLSAFILLNSVSFSPKSLAESFSPVKVILDCDMGYMNDDALSLSMLLKAEEHGLVEILGITLAGGNNFIDAPYENYGEIQFGSSKYTGDFLALLGRTDIPCFHGTDFPGDMNGDSIQELASFYNGLEYGKFNDNYGAIHYFTSVDPELLCDSNDAAAFLIQSVRENPDEVVIFAIGPTMNIAKAVKQDPDFAPHVKAIYYMGGALGDPCMIENNRSEMVEGIDGANVTPYAEYNVLYDPAAFATCITAHFPLQYILPASCNVDIDRSIADKFIVHSNGSGISGLWADHFREYIQDYPYWDPLTVFAFLCPDAVVASSVKYVTVNTDRLSKYVGRTDGYSPEEYELLPPEQQSLCGRAEIIYEMEGFWDYTIDLLCN
ncbi:MAG: nucleoside hydrolase [Eubacteriales bacterium]|nr:nucleoside hydrolase [Eubacteriales bacterium]